MDKQLIERIALEVCEGIPLEMKTHLPGYSVRFAERFIARIDAERGKEAVAFRLTDGDDVEYNGIDQFSCGRTCGEPLFLSPTIPEGMALVPKSAMLWLNGEGDDFEQDRPGKFWWRSKFRELLAAAAQGERNAD